jgi:hypothetical protein
MMIHPQSQTPTSASVRECSRLAPLASPRPHDGHASKHPALPALRSYPWFATLVPESLESLAAAATHRSHSAGQDLSSEEVLCFALLVTRGSLSSRSIAPGI